MKNSKELIELFNQKEEKSNKRTLMTILIPLLLAIGLVFYASTKIKSNSDEKQELTQKTENLTKENSELKTILNVENSDIDKAKEVALKYIEYRNSRSSNQISNLLSDTLYRYYREENVLKNYVISDQKIYWKKYPKEALITNENIQLSVNQGITTALIKGQYTRDSIKFNEVMEEVKLNSSNKIIGIRQFVNN